MRARIAMGANTIPEQSACQCQQHAIGEKLPSDPSGGSAQGQPRADLPAASRSARQEKTGHVQASQAKQHRCRREQEPEWLRPACAAE